LAARNNSNIVYTESDTDFDRELVSVADVNIISFLDVYVRATTLPGNWFDDRSKHFVILQQG